MARRKHLEPAWLLVVIIPAILIFAAYQWLTTSDSLKVGDVTGKEVLESMTTSFWVWVWLGIFGSIIFFALAYLNETGVWIGKHLKGYTGITIIFVVLALACVIGPWIKVMQAKVDNDFNKPKTQTYESSNTNSLPGNLYTIYSCADGILPA